MCTDSIFYDLYLRMLEFDSVLLWEIHRVLTDNPGYKIYRVLKWVVYLKDKCGDALYFICVNKSYDKTKTNN